MGWPQTPSSPIRSQSRGRFESNLPCAPHPANGVQSAHIWIPPYGYAWATLWVRHVISLRALLQNITRLHPSFQLVLSRGIRGERHGHNDSTERNITTLDMSQSDKQKGKSFHGLGEAKHFKRKKRKKNLLRKTFAPTNQTNAPRPHTSIDHDSSIFKQHIEITIITYTTGLPSLQ